MPSSLKLAREYGDDLGIVFVESQGATMQKQEAFAWDHKWMGTNAIWTTEAPFRTGSNGLPNFALLSSEGEVLLMGNPLSMHKQIVEAIEAEIAKASSGPDDSPKSLKKAWKYFGKGEYAKAIAEARKVEAKGGDDAEAAGVAAIRIAKHADGQLDRVERLIEGGHFLKAIDMIEDLDKGLADDADLAARATAIAERLETPEVEAEVKAAQSLARIEATLAEDGFEDKIVKRLEKFAEKNPNTKAAERARYLATLAEAV